MQLGVIQATNTKVLGVLFRTKIYFSTKKSENLNIIKGYFVPKKYYSGG